MRGYSPFRQGSEVQSSIVLVVYYSVLYGWMEADRAVAAAGTSPDGVNVDNSNNNNNNHNTQ